MISRNSCASFLLFGNVASILLLVHVAFVLPKSISSLALHAPAPTAAAAACQRQRMVSIVTGASGFVGREVVHALRRDAATSSSGAPDCKDEVLCLVRGRRVDEETRYWDSVSRRDAHDCAIRVMPYEMCDGGQTLANALEYAYGGSSSSSDSDDAATSSTKCCVYHVASVFGPTDDHRQTALDNVRGTEEVVKTMSKYAPNIKLVLTSSMAAVRATNQPPKNGGWYTPDDWNTVSELGTDWGSSYQWSKTQSERRAWELCQQYNVPLTVLCPSFVFGPPSDGVMSNSYSLSLVGQWIRGESEVQSRLCVDVRDAALAHVRAGTSDAANGKRYILSSEARLSSLDVGKALAEIVENSGIGDASSIRCDTLFDGGAIKIGEREVEASELLEKDLGVVCRPTEETMRDMAKTMLL